MAINIGAMFAPTAAIKIMDYAQQSLGVSEADSYHFAFAVACISLIFSILIYYAFQGTYRHVIANEKKNAATGVEADAQKSAVPELSPAETKERIVCLCLVFAVVIFFWMAFHQNGNTLTLFARDFTQTTSEGLQSMAFDVTNLVAGIFIVYALFAIFQSKTLKGKGVGALIIVGALSFLFYKYNALEAAGAAGRGEETAVPAAQARLRRGEGRLDAALYQEVRRYGIRRQHHAAGAGPL